MSDWYLAGNERWRGAVVAGAGGGGGNNFTLVAHTSTSDPGGGGALSVTIDSTGANFLAVAVSQYNQAIIGTLTENKSNTRSGLTARIAPSEAYVRIYYYANATVGSGHTFTFTNGAQLFGAMAVMAWSGANATPFDVENGATGVAVISSLAPGSVTPSNANSLLVTAINDSTGGSGSFAVDSGFTITDNIPTVTNVEGLALAYFKQTTIGALNPTWSWGGSPNDAAATIAVFKP